MSVDVIKRFVLFFIMCLVQVLLLNHFHLLGGATPLFYVYFVVTFRRGYPRWASMLWSLPSAVFAGTVRASRCSRGYALFA